MKKQVLTGLVCLLFAVQISAQHILSGHVLKESDVPAEGASVQISGLNLGTSTNVDGLFRLENVPPGRHTLVISYIGFATIERHVRVAASTNLGKILLQQQFIKGEEATISALGAGKKTPMAYTNMNKQEIAEKNFGQDIPYLVGLTPSLITSSDAGHGIGYTSMRIRGTDANRINVTINGIPLNDAESHSVFWVDLPELASSAEQIQIQRGVGTSTNGAAAFGATVNLQTLLLEKEPYVKYDFTAGSFNTLRNSVSVGTGLIKEKFAVDFRLSDLHSDGYIDRSWTDLQSYFLSAGWYEEKSSLKFITFGGFEELYQSWGGVPSALLKIDRTFNEMGAYIDTSGQVAYYENQVDHYDQVHYQLHYFKEITKKLSLNAAAHYTMGNGYYEQYESGEDYSFYSMEYPVVGSDTIMSTDLVRRKWLDNDFYGVIGSLSYNYDKGAMILGGGWNRYYGLHFGKVIWANHFGNNSPGHQWYEGVGDKSDWNIYGKYYNFLSERLTAFADLQVRGIDHIIEGTDADNRNVTQDHSYLFFNPKAGINYEPAAGQRAFLSYARANREPNRNNYTDAPLNKPPVKETLNDIEAGYSVLGNVFSSGITIYYMGYKDQLVLTGRLNEVGYPVMTNVPESYRAGVEIEMAANLYDKLSWSGNLSLSRNRIADFVNYIDNWDYWYDTENEPYQIEEQIGNSALAYSPSVVAASNIGYHLNDGFTFSILSKYVGKQYLDNTSNENYILRPYFVNDLRVSYTLRPGWAEAIAISIVVPNVLNTEYETNAWLYRFYSEGQEGFLDGYYPQAGRYVMLGVSIEF